MTTEVRLIRGKVARILTSREVALNIGRKDGVDLDMLFDILDPNAQDIEDPDTHETIGSIYRPKVRVRITTVEERISVASTYKSKRTNIGGAGIGVSSWGSLFDPPKWVNKYETLRTKEGTWEHLDEEDSYVATGDPVVRALDDDTDSR